jgi:LemA protein
MAVLIPIAIIGALALWAVASYNRLVGLRNQVLNGWRQIDVQLKRRHDLIPNLVNAVRGSMDFERDTLTAVMEAREGADRHRPRRRGAEGRPALAGTRPAAGRGGKLPDAEIQR